MDIARAIMAISLVGGTLFTVGTMFHFLTPIVAPTIAAGYENAALFRPWQGATQVYMLVHPWLYGIVFTGVFLGARHVVGEQNLGGLRDGALYGLAVFAVGSLPVYALNLASVQVPLGIIISWVLQSLCQYLLAGLVIGYCYARVAG